MISVKKAKKNVDKKRSAASKKGWATRRKNAKKTVKKKSKGRSGRVSPSQKKVLRKA